MNNFFIISKKVNGGFCYLNNLTFSQGLEIFQKAIKKKNKKSVVFGIKDYDKRIILEYDGNGIKLLNFNLLNIEKVEVIKKELNIV